MRTTHWFFLVGEGLTYLAGNTNSGLRDYGCVSDCKFAIRMVACRQQMLDGSTSRQLARPAIASAYASSLSMVYPPCTVCFWSNRHVISCEGAFDARALDSLPMHAGCAARVLI
jgi:hypothetical protein